MDQSWINASRISEFYDKCVEEFLESAKRNGVEINGRYYCLCVNCLNRKGLHIELIREHLLCDGFLKNYTMWTWHGKFLNLRYVSETECNILIHILRIA